MENGKAEGYSGRWRRPLAYLLLLAGISATVFSGNIGRGLQIDTTLVQLAALGLLLLGAGLFYSVRQRAGRIAIYREVFSPTDEGSDRPDNPEKV